MKTDIVPRWGGPGKISSDNGTPFVSDAIKQLGHFLGIDLIQHCSYHPASGGAVERENGTLKAKLAKCCEETDLPWTKVLPIVLMYMRMRKRARVNLGPSESLFGRPPHVGVEPVNRPLPKTPFCHSDMLQYCQTLSSALSQVYRQVKDALPVPAEQPLHDFKPGDYVVVGDLRPKHWW